jgi:mannose-1-phosphate guanylyltransferase / mannose-6-phosphate isomerase
MTERIHPVILCGGAGTRLWPSSREQLPKQFLKLIGERSTFQEACLRVGDSSQFERPVVVANRDYRFLVREQLEEIGVDAEIVLEPARRNSAPAAAAAAKLIASREPNALVLTLAADHLVSEPAGFVAACRRAAAAARAGYIVTFGIEPEYATTDYGYIRPGPPIAGAEGAQAVAAFVEKPDAATAARYVKDGYLWNAGIFLFRADVFLDEYRTFAASSADATARAVAKATHDLGFMLLDPEAFIAAEKQSIDYAVMEKTRRAAVLPARFGWSDLGGWNAVWTLSSQDEEGNAARGTVVLVGARDNLVISEGKVAALIGVDNLVVVVEDDAVLVAARERSEELREVVAQLRKQGRPEADLHTRVRRPWGSFETLDASEHFKVKRIVVNPGGRLSLQRHQKRAEHWVVVKGTARITIGKNVRDLKENESIYVPLGAAHRLENAGSEPLEIIEVQTGSYFGEDDIVRIEDDYRRRPEE